MNRSFLQKIMNFILRALAKVEYIGQEHLPEDGSVIIATNHMSRMDTLYLFITPRRKDITALVANKYLKYPIFNLILKIGGVVWLDRDKADFTAFKKAAEIIRSGVAMGIAPEGTRSTTGQLQEGKPGTALLAMRTKTTIVPVGITGTDTYFKRLLTFRRPHVILRFGPPIELPELDRSRRDEQLKEYTDEIMCRIAALLDEKNRGVYRNHPRLQEILQGAEQSLQLEQG
jgi:1-acyl-sn-glycerol-3-phosphate acyltransferase